MLARKGDRMSESEVKANNVKLTSRAYNAFVKDLRLKDIRLASATIKNLDCSYSPSSAEVRWKIAAKYENRDGKIEVLNRYNVRILELEKGKGLKATLSVIFCVTYDSKMPMTEELFEKFREQNLLLHTWPYFREFAHNAVLRMGWPPFIAPIFTT
jgi:hypothetical protein